ncbi:hypothetical protein AX16_008200 [Volvariella volvacea WC 439]|nr:hypothetical protein AX16_008200 [Volvariella volvacea WC 439]
MEIVLLILFWIDSDGLIIISNPLGRVYSLTIFFNILTYKRSAAARGTTGRTTGDLTTEVGLDSVRTPHTDEYAMEGITVGSSAGIVMSKDEASIRSQTTSSRGSGSGLAWKWGLRR